MKPIHTVLEDCCSLLLDPTVSAEDVRAILALVDLWRRGFKNLHESDATSVKRIRALHNAYWPSEVV